MQRIQWENIKTFLLSPKVVLAICAVFLIYSFVFQKPGLARQIKLVHENKALKSEIELMHQRVELLQNKVIKLESDMDALKAEAAKYGYGEPDEVIVKVSPQ